MNQEKIKSLFESDNVSGYLTLQKIEMDDQQFLKLLSIKPSEINIILARVSSFIKGDETKSKKELVNDILEVLERSAVSRQFVGIGANQEYQLIKGFPVRKGDPYESMPDPNSELVLKPSEVYIGWTSDNSMARDDATKYDASKGEPIGGLLVEAHVDVTKLLFDINAVVKTVKAKINIINQYNEMAAPGKSLSKTVTHYLATEAPLYHGQWELISTNKVVNTRVLDKWIWNTSSEPKTIKWVAANQQDTQPQADAQAQPASQPQPVADSKSGTEQNSDLPLEADPSLAQHKQLKERIMRLFESEDKFQQPVALPVYEDVLDEAIWQGMKNFMAKAFGTIRGKKLKYLQSLVKFYETERQIYELAKEFSTHVDKDTSRSSYAENKIQKIDANIAKTKDILRDVQSGLDLDDIPEPSSTDTDTGDTTSKINSAHSNMKKIQPPDEDESLFAPNVETKE